MAASVVRFHLSYAKPCGVGSRDHERLARDRSVGVEGAIERRHERERIGHGHGEEAGRDGVSLRDEQLDEWRRDHHRGGEAVPRLIGIERTIVVVVEICAHAVGALFERPDLELPSGVGHSYIR